MNEKVTDQMWQDFVMYSSQDLLYYIIDVTMQRTMMSDINYDVIYTNAYSTIADTVSNPQLTLDQITF